MKAREKWASAKKNHGVVRTSPLSSGRKGDLPLGADTRIGARYLCHTQMAGTPYMAGDKRRPVLIYGLFWNAEKTKIRAAAVIPGTTQKMNRIYRSDFPTVDEQIMRKMSSPKEGKFEFSELQVIPNNSSFFNLHARPLGTPDCEPLLWKQFLECRLYALFFARNREHFGLDKSKINDDWIYEGPLFTIPEDFLADPLFAPDIKGSLNNQMPWYPPSMTQFDIGMIAKGVLDKGAAGFVTSQDYIAALDEGRDPYASMINGFSSSSRSTTLPNGYRANGTGGATIHPADPEI